MVVIDNLSFGYTKELLFENLSMKFEMGNIYGLLGLNGSGKTSLIKLMAGLMFPKEGKITVLGQEPRKRDPNMLTNIFVLSEDFSVPNISQRDYVKSRVPFYPHFNHEHLKESLRKFDLPENSVLRKLSYGQRKKFFIAFGLASGCKLLLMDEPTNGLDIPSKTVFRSLAAEAVSNDRILLISTHQIRDVNDLIDPLIILHNGKILFAHSMVEIEKHIHIKRTLTPFPADSQGLIYSQDSIGGYWSVWTGAGDNDSYMDMEVLFNAVISAPQTLIKEMSCEPNY